MAKPIREFPLKDDESIEQKRVPDSTARRYFGLEVSSSKISGRKPPKEVL